jgi:hypothetical protein
MRCLPCILTLAAACPALAQLRPEEVLVVYDSRIPDSLAVAEYYAGSKKVPGGAGGLPGARPGVRVVDLAPLGAASPTAPDITYPNFVATLRTPLRNYLASSGLSKEIRCLVLTKGIAHRIFDTDNVGAGDNPSQLVTEYQAADATMASVDIELTLLWQNLDSGEAGGSADSLADGVILNPYWRNANPVRIYPTTHVDFTGKTFSANLPGPTWLPSGTAGSAQGLLPGDYYMVCRLDAPTVADVRAMIDRAGAILYDTLNHAAVLDESGSNGIADASANSEFDNTNSAFPPLRDADDYEITRDEFAADTRFAASFARYNALSGSNQFLVGPRFAWNGSPILVTEPVVLVTHYGSNHSGIPQRSPDNAFASTFYAESFNLANGAIMNTMESYNARDFGGRGQHPSILQQQISTFLAAGGTFGVGNVWEPLADTVPDSRYLARHFIRGTLSFAEAAYTSIPALSWQQIVIGDPLARAWRTSEDIDANARINIDDLYAWERTPVDVNRNGTTDSADRAFVVRAVRAWERADVLTGRR